jgi:outer membrane protein OmpA-like peptidoglycan-associated protein
MSSVSDGLAGGRFSSAGKVIGRFAVTGLVIMLSGTAAASSDRDRTLAILQSIASEQSGFELKAWVNAGTGEPIPIGHHVEYHFLAQSQGHVTVVHLDSHGVVTLIHPNGLGSGSELTAGVERRFPDVDADFTVAAEPPVGSEYVLVLATPAPISPADLGVSLAHDPIAVVEAADATAVAERLRERFAEFEPQSRAVTHVEQRIVGRSAEAEYESVDIVDYFTERTRSIRRPKLDLHVHFDTGSYELDASARSNLDSVASALADPRMKDMHFVVSGHTDDVGEAAYNDILSRQRAEGVVEYLTEERRIEPERLEITYYGERRPLEPNVSDGARLLNRRVEFELQR